MEKARRISYWLLATILYFSLLYSTTSCSKDDDSKSYKYINASTDRDNTPLEDRGKYAPYGWRLECLTDQKMPKNYRTCFDEFIRRDPVPCYDSTYLPTRKGLENLKASASADFSSAGFDGLLSSLRKLHQGPIMIVDLRSESHGLLNGIHISHYGLQNWANIGLNLEETMKKERDEIHATQGKTIEVATIDSDNDYVPINPMDIRVSSAYTEEEACQQRGVGYMRFNLLDHAFPSDQNRQVLQLHTIPAPQHMAALSLQGWKGPHVNLPRLL